MGFRVLILTVLFMSCVLRMHASPQPNDPRVIINNGHVPLDSCIPVAVGNDFSFNADDSGGGQLCFLNNSGEDWHFLEIKTRETPPENTILCGGTAFASCLVQPHQEGGFTVIDFSGGPGISSGQDFTIDLGPSGWRRDEQFLAFANPEPGTLSLFAIGLAPLLRRMRAV